ncbi:MAG: hypothetical protein KGI50_00450 [Patescibacteria group bacterium]|nr:hypothetical protein [Patescibacteria group bacterium]MDE2438174.1 hypothetical protein [Patescibacteria group bacterium]
MRTFVSFFVSIIIVIALAGTTSWLLVAAQNSANYLGLPAVPCVDPTQPILQRFTVHIIITLNGAPLPLSPSIGHDPGKCLRVISTNDASGAVIIQSNDHIIYTLGDFFGTWRQKFDSSHFLGHPLDTSHALTIYKDGNPVNTLADTELTPSSTYAIVYETAVVR